MTNIRQDIDIIQGSKDKFLANLALKLKFHLFALVLSIIVAQHYIEIFQLILTIVNSLGFHSFENLKANLLLLHGC